MIKSSLLEVVKVLVISIIINFIFSSFFFTINEKMNDRKATPLYYKYASDKSYKNYCIDAFYTRDKNAIDKLARFYIEKQKSDTEIVKIDWDGDLNFIDVNDTVGILENWHKDTTIVKIIYNGNSGYTSKYVLHDDKCE